MLRATVAGQQEGLKALVKSGASGLPFAQGQIS